jgi:hypothetical protein
MAEVTLPDGRVVMETPEDVRLHLGWTQAAFAQALDMPLRTYEDKVKRGFRTVDLMAAKWVYLKATEGSELH